MVERFDPQDPHIVENLRMAINDLVTNYLKTTSSISQFVEVFNAEDYVVEHKRKNAVSINIKNFVDEMVKKLIEHSVNSGIEIKLPKVLEMLKLTILPPDEGEIKRGSGEGIEKKMYIPRTQYLIELLSEMGEQYEIMGGKNTSDMMRERTYFIFLLPNLKKTLFINNEEGNTSFVMYNVSSKQEAIDLATLTKDEIRAKERHDHPYVQIDWTGDEVSWKEKISFFLKLEKAPDKIIPTNIEGESNAESHATALKEKRTFESAVKELEEAYMLWSGQDKNEKREFNTTWLRKNGFEGLYQWARKEKILLKTLISHASLEAQKYFEKVERHTPESALLELEQAYIEWKAQDTKDTGIFNSTWLQNNNHHGLYMWAYRNGGIDALVSKASKEVQNDFEKFERRTYTEDTVISLLESAYLDWKNKKAQSNIGFSLPWLKKNGFAPLLQWMYRHGGIDKYVHACSENLQKDFQKIEKKNFLSFDDLKKDVREKGIQTVTEYRERFKLFNWPASPNVIYKEQWISWPSFLGKK